MYYPILARLIEPRNMAGPFEVVPYSETWPKTFQALEAQLEPALGALCRRIEHVGSTSVRGLPAKPVIDIDVVIDEDVQFEDVIERLAAIGYAFEGDKGVPGRYAFASPPGLPNHHLYVCAEDASELRRHLLFRDYLRRHPEQAAAYGELKRRLAKENPVDRVAYTDGKTGWIERALKMVCHETLPTSTR